MSVSFDLNSVKIEPEFQNAKTAAFLTDSQRVHCHLTEGFDPAKICKLGHGAAMQALGSIHLSAGPGELKGWEFGFIQVVQANAMSVFYAGRTRKEGSIAIQAHLAPALKTRVLLDSSAADSPWIGRFGFPQSPPVAKELMKDHPSACESKTIQNANTKRPNFLFHILTELEFWSTFSAKDPTGKFQHFAHFHWMLRFDFKFAWRGNVIAITTSKSFVRPDEVVKGAPSPSAVQAILASPVGPFAIDELNGARRAVSIGTANRTDNDSWFANVPAEFFQ